MFGTNFSAGRADPPAMRPSSLQPHHVLIGAIAAVLLWLVACGGQLPASLGGGALGNGPDPGGGTAPACSAAQAAPAPDTSPDHGCRSPGDGAGPHHGHGHGHHGHHRGHRHGHHRHHSDDDRDHTSMGGGGHDAASGGAILALAHLIPRPQEVGAGR